MEIEMRIASDKELRISYGDMRALDFQPNGAVYVEIEHEWMNFTLDTDQWRIIRDWINAHILKEDMQGGQV